jgi:broad specificity phosphatase PhoE
MASEMWILRHGETEWSRSGQHTSHTDIPLTDHGREQARRAADTLAGVGFSLVLCSPLQRALETCRLTGFEQAAELCDDLHEWDYGDYEGITSDEIHAERPDWDLWRDGCPGGETAAEVCERVDRVLARAAGVSGEVLCVSHGHVLRALTARWLGMEVEAGAHFALTTAGVGVLGHEHETTPVLLRWSS